MPSPPRASVGGQDCRRRSVGVPLSRLGFLGVGGVRSHPAAGRGLSGAGIFESLCDEFACDRKAGTVVRLPWIAREFLINSSFHRRTDGGIAG